MKVGLPDPREDYKRVKAVRKAIGEDIKLMVDVNTVWDLKTAMVWGRRLEEFDIIWLEEKDTDDAENKRDPGGDSEHDESR